MSSSRFAGSDAESVTGQQLQALAADGAVACASPRTLQLTPLMHEVLFTPSILYIARRNGFF